VYLGFTPEEELEELEAEGYDIIQREGRMLVHHPLLGVMASKPVELHHRQTEEVNLQRAAILFALENLAHFLDWAEDD
jgi:hypothetical protein